jgi:hypothetical protein
MDIWHFDRHLARRCPYATAASYVTRVPPPPKGWALKLMYINSQHTLQNKERRPQNTETHVHKTTYGPLIDTALYIMLLMRANPLLGQVGGGWALEIRLFWAQTVTHLTAQCHFTEPKPLPLALIMELLASTVLCREP